MSNQNENPGKPDVVRLTGSPFEIGAQLMDQIVEPIIQSGYRRLPREGQLELLGAVLMKAAAYCATLGGDEFLLERMDAIKGFIAKRPTADIIASKVH